MDCIVAAGGVPSPEDPIYTYTQGKVKALLDMNGRTMLERVVDGLQAARHVDNIVVVGLASNMGMHFQRPVHHIADQGNLIDNALAGINWLREHHPPADLILASSADIPTITGPIVDQFIELCRPFDKGLYYTFVTKEIMEKRFPHSNRTYVKLKDAPIAGGDIILFRPEMLLENMELWEALSNARKHAWRIARAVGIGLMLKLLLRRLSFAEIEETAERLTGYPAKIIVPPHAELAMDADKPHQVDMLRDDLARQHA